MGSSYHGESRATVNRTAFTLIEMMIAISIICMLAALLLPAVQQARERVRILQCQNNLMQIGLAIQNYHNAHSVLPPGVVDRSGPIVPTGNQNDYQISWITQILPMLDQNSLYREVDFRFGAYSPVNSTAAGKVVPILVCPSNSVRSLANYAGIHNDFEVPIEVKQNGMFFLNSSIQWGDVKDGLSNTIMVAETRSGSGIEMGWISGTSSTLRNGVVWQNADSPETPPIYIVRPLKQVSNGQAILLSSLKGNDVSEFAKTIPVGGPCSAHSVGFNAVMADGGVHHINHTVDSFVLRHLTHRADGELIGEF